MKFKLQSPIKFLNKSASSQDHGFISTTSTSFMGADFSALDNQKLLEYFVSVPQLYMAISMKAKMFSNMNLRVVNNAKVDVVNDYSQLISKPNFHQSQKEFLIQTKVFRELFGNEFIHGLKPVGFPYPDQLNTLDPSRLSVNDTDINSQDPLFLQSEMPEFNYIFQDNKKRYPISSKDVIHINNPAESQITFKSSIIGMSDVSPLIQALNNIKGAYESRGMLIHHRGALGILTNNSKDAAGATLAMDDDEKTQLQSDYQKYGTLKSQYQMLLTNLDLNYTQMSKNPKELMLFEEIEDDFQTILGAFGLRRELFPTTKGTTFENQKEATKATYENTIMPEAAEWVSALDNYFDNKGFKTIADYAHLSVFDSDLKERGIALKQNVEALDKAFHSKAITLKTYQDEMEKMLSRR